MAKKQFFRDVLGFSKDSSSYDDIILRMDEEKCNRIAYMSYKFEHEVTNEILEVCDGSEDEEEMARLTEAICKEGLRRLYEYCESEHFTYKYPQENATALLDCETTEWLPVAVEEWLELDADYTEAELERIASTHKHPALSNLEASSNNLSINEYIRKQIKKYDNYLKYMVIDEEGGDYDFNAEDAEFTPVCLQCGHLRLIQYTECPNCGADFYPSEEPELVCSKCGEVLEEGSKFCAKCGAPVDEVKFCSNCGNKIECGSKFCPKCGKAL